MLVAAVAAEPQEHVPASTPQAPQFPGTLALPFSCMEPGCFRFGSAGFAHDDDLHLHTLGYHVPVQASVSHQPGPAYANAFGHENGYNQGQGVNNHPIEGLIPGDSYSMNATGEQTDEHWHFENYEPADGPFQHGSYMNGLDGQDGDQSHGQWV
ncbi:hypothetical protein GGR51DRAFT_520050 [Nemania sp. FL0031]|nr:hypothetical protein GGR51DRAFT_520050 [Nemania sp. FL0031]